MARYFISLLYCNSYKFLRGFRKFLFLKKTQTFSFHQTNLNTNKKIWRKYSICFSFTKLGVLWVSLKSYSRCIQEFLYDSLGASINIAFKTMFQSACSISCIWESSIFLEACVRKIFNLLIRTILIHNITLTMTLNKTDSALKKIKSKFTFFHIYEN